MKNKYEIRGNVTVIIVMYKQKELQCLIDTECLEVIDKYSGTWCATKSSTHLYLNIKFNKTGKTKRHSMHRLITNPPKGMQVDHINHNTLDNRRENLRFAKPFENQQNKIGARADSTTGVRGVGWNKRLLKYYAALKLNGKSIHIGYFDNILDAENAIKLARAKYMPYSIEAKCGIDHSELTLPQRRNTKISSGIRGISWHEKAGKWDVRIQRGDKTYRAGLYLSIDEAKIKLEELKNTL